MIQNDHMVSEEIVDIFLSVKLLPIFKAQSWKLLKHLTLL